MERPQTRKQITEKRKHAKNTIQYWTAMMFMALVFGFVIAGVFE